MADLSQLFGCGSLDLAFGVGMQTVTPWRRAARSKRAPLYDSDIVARVLAGPVQLVELDPRDLACTQPWVLRHHVRYYLDDVWERTGRTSADMHVDSNRFPLVWVPSAGQPVILAGHHRAMAALLQGRPLLARVAVAVGAPELPVPGDVAVTPRLRLDPNGIGVAPVGHSTMGDAQTAADRITAGETVSVPDPSTAQQVLELLGLDGEECRDRLRVASGRLSR